MRDETVRDTWWPRQQVLNVLNFWYPECIDHRYGGYVAGRDSGDGHVYDGGGKHLVATCRLVHNFAVGRLVGGPDWCGSAAEHGLSFLLSAHRDDDRGGFHWRLDGTDVVDDSRSAYGHAFALLATATAARADVPGARAGVETAFDALDRFFEPEHGLHADECDADWETVDAYRGQNANMHACEALLAAHEATGDRRYLDRAYRVAEALVRDPPTEEGLLWEHYTEAWEPDFEYNRDEPAHKFRPWGYQPGHHAEWAKLCCLLARRREESWLETRAADLFDAAVEYGWREDGGFVYTFDPGGDPVVADVYGWPVAEATGAAALLADRVDEAYWEWYERCWRYARENLLNPKYGTWYDALDESGEPRIDNPTPRVEPGYHPVANAFVALDVLAD